MDIQELSKGRPSFSNATPMGIMTKPIEETEMFVLDSNAPLHIPKEKITYTQKWNWTPKGQEGIIKLGSMSIVEKIKSLRWNSGTIIDTELHVVFLPHLPVEIYRGKNVNITLSFTGTSEESDSTLAIASFPICLHTHIIFFPGHSFSLKKGGSYPWCLSFMTDADIKESYITADVILQLKAYNTPLSQYSEKRGAHIISLVPPSEKPTGVILTRPRIGGDWKASKMKSGIKRQRDLDLIKAIQEVGIDVEGLQALGALKETMYLINKILGSSYNTQDNDCRNKIIAATLAAVKKKKAGK